MKGMSVRDFVGSFSVQVNRNVWMLLDLRMKFGVGQMGSLRYLEQFILTDSPLEHMLQ